MVGGDPAADRHRRHRWRCSSALISVRTAGIYTIMITLAIGVAFFYFTRQNYAIFNGHSAASPGWSRRCCSGINWRDPLPFYYLSLAVAVLSYVVVLYVSRSHLRHRAAGDPRQSAAHERAGLQRHLCTACVAHAFAGFIAALGGILYVWFNGRVSPGTIGIGPVINILVIAVLGGMRHPIGPFIGALSSCCCSNFAIDLIDPRALQHAHRPDIPGHRAVLARRPAGPLGKARRWARSGGAAAGWRQKQGL